MKSFRTFFALTLLNLLIISFSASAAIDANAPVVQLQATNNGNCIENNIQLNNCFTDPNSLRTWIYQVRKPSSTTPLLVKIGPGNFGQMVCAPAIQMLSNISFQGSGMGQTKISSWSLGKCNNLSFSDMTLTGAGAYTIALLEGDNGINTTWTNVEVFGGESAWKEFTCGPQAGTHYWFNSRINVASAGGVGVAYRTSCDVSWFFGTEITVTASGSQLNQLNVLEVVGPAEVHVYGGVIRALNNGTGVASGSNYAAVSASTSGMVHIHGTGIDVISQSASPIVALYATSGSTIHANESSYNLSTGAGGTVTRILNSGGHVHAPYLWEHIPDPLTVPNFTSVTGADITTVTTGTSDGQPHLVIYSANCASKWYDTVDRICRP